MTGGYAGWNNYDQDNFILIRIPNDFRTRTSSDNDRQKLDAFLNESITVLVDGPFRRVITLH